MFMKLSGGVRVYLMQLILDTVVIWWMQWLMAAHTNIETLCG
jgi:hypothetical protein